MKTTFLLLPGRASVLAILFTGVVDRLVRDGNVRAVVITTVPNVEEHYRKGFSTEQVVFEGPFRLWGSRSLWNYLRRSLDVRFWRIFDQSPFMNLAHRQKGYKRLHPLRQLFEHALGMPFPGSQLLYRLFHRLHTRWPVDPGKERNLFERYRPDLVFTNAVTTPFEYEFLKLAKRRGIPTVGMINSWDELSMYRMVLPCDRYITWNRVEREELKQIYGVPESQIRITGIPQYDPYADRPTKEQLDGFLEGLGLDPSLPVVLYATSSPLDYPDGLEVLPAFLDRLQDERGRAVQVLIRVHPLDGHDYRPLVRPGVVLQVPGLDVGMPDYRLFDDADVRVLRDTLYACDVVVNMFSSMTPEAVATGKPSVNIAFDSTEVDYYKSVRRAVEAPHFRPLIESGATVLAHDLDGLVAHVLRYIDDPSLDEAARAEYQETMCYKLDGCSAERIVSYLLEVLGTDAKWGWSH